MGEPTDAYIHTFTPTPTCKHTHALYTHKCAHKYAHTYNEKGKERRGKEEKKEGGKEEAKFAEE